MKGGFCAPSSAKEALEIKLATDHAFFLAGGTILNSWRKNSNINLISLQNIGCNTIEKKEGFINIGAMTPLNEIAQHPFFQDNLQELAHSIRAISKNIRNMATLGGAIASMMTRSDIIPLFMVLKAELVCLSSKGEHIIPISEYLISPALHSSNLILSVKIKEERNIILKSARFARSSNDHPVVKTACTYICENGTMKNVNIASGGTYDKVTKLVPIELILEGQSQSNGFKNNMAKINMELDEMRMPPSDIRGPGRFKKALLAAQLEDIFTAEECER